jgi:hypothetical protein
MLVSLALGCGCLWRAWIIGRNGLDQDGNIKSTLQYQSVKFWGGIGIMLAGYPIISLLYTLLPPVTEMR